MSEPITEGLTEPFGHARGDSFLIRGTPPAAGSSFAFPIPGEYVARPVSCTFTLVTDGNAANRYVTVEYGVRDGPSYCVNAAGLVVTATTMIRFAGSSQRGVAEWATGTDVLFPLEPAFLFPGASLQINVASIQAGDTLTGIIFLVDRFFTGPRGEPVGVQPAVAPVAALGRGRR